MIGTIALVPAFITLFIVIDPPALAPLYLALTQGMAGRERLMIGLRACIVAGVLLLVFLLLGEAVLASIGITMPAFRIAGGILLFLTALDMLFERRQKRREGNAGEGADPGHDPSVFPLAVPLIAGPGAITTVILFAGRAQGALDLAVIALVTAANLGMVLVFFAAAPVVERVLGRVGINVVTRVLGMLLAALAIQFILDGLLASGLIGAGAGGA
ncbi:MAG: MarC family protein [Rubellimicrobium sp.]|nr:MarC family protein [Rubellimicrobium sp.]